MWEKKTGVYGSGYPVGGYPCPGSTCSADPHDVNNTYSWSTGPAPYAFDGSVATEFLAKLNVGPGFSGHVDWRLPKSAGRPDLSVCGPGANETCATGEDAELESIVTTEACTTPPCIPLVFGPAAQDEYSLYWSASSPPDGSPQWAPLSAVWVVSFRDGIASGTSKGWHHFARAVRGP
jgi:hypothetical protein